MQHQIKKFFLQKEEKVSFFDETEILINSLCLAFGITTLSIMTFSIIALSIEGLLVTLRIKGFLVTISIKGLLVTISIKDLLVTLNSNDTPLKGVICDTQHT